jgi:nicotinate-nucleotide--dimethylbenzimidazole phosphoribosyltransferase
MKKENLWNFTLTKPSEVIFQQIKKNWDMVAKPLDGLGEFEETIAQIGAIHNNTKIDITKKAIIVMCADNGIVEEGISQSGQEVTSVVTEFMGKNQTSVGKMAAVIGADVVPIDIGIHGTKVFPGVKNCKICAGTRDFLVEPAMTEDEVLAAIEIGIQAVQESKDNGYRILGTGEMGIGNTTTSSAIVAALLRCDAASVTGRGAGLSNEGLAHKCEVIDQALAKYKLGKYSLKQNDCEDKEEVFRTLATVGGLDIAGLVGVYLGGARYHIPVVMDGLISSVAALVAERLVPGVREYVIPSHLGKEPAAQKIANELGVCPVIHAKLALGEGTGAVMMFSLLDMALALYDEQTTFSDIAVEQYERFV